VHHNKSTRDKAVVNEINDIFHTTFDSISESSRNPDIHLVYSEDGKSIKLEDIATFKAKMIFKPFQSAQQVGIILDAQHLTTEAQNALLKTLEESNKSTRFILTVNNSKNILPTINSRCEILYPHDTSEVINDTADIITFLDADFHAKFDIVENIAKKEKFATLKFLDRLARVYHQQLLDTEIAIDKDKLKHEKFINDLYIHIKSSNISRKTALIDLVIQLYM
jgi:DNA polymerase III delta prime subunit